MARLPTDDQSSASGVSEFVKAYLDTHSLSPDLLRISYTGLAAGDRVTVVTEQDKARLGYLYPTKHTPFRADLVPLDGTEFDDPEFIEASEPYDPEFGYLPTCLISEELTELRADELRNALTLICRQQSIGLDQALFYLLFVWQILRAYGYARHGGGVGISTGQVPHGYKIDQIGKQADVKPATSIAVLLSIWRRLGVRLAAGLLKPTPASRGTFLYSKMPPLWNRASGGETDQADVEVALTIDSDIAEAIESYVESPDYLTDLQPDLIEASDAGKSESGDAEAAGEAATPIAVLTSAPLDARIFRRMGANWLLAFNGSSTTAKQSKGMEYIALLLTSPGQEFDALTMYHTVAKQTGAGDPVYSRMTQKQLEEEGLVVGCRIGSEVMDDEQLKAYRAAYEEAQEDLAEAERFSDSGRIAAAKKTIQFIEEEIKKHRGLGGRVRKTDASENARVNVKKAISSAIRSIDAAHKPLANHLRCHITTGYLLKYSPEDTIRWEVS